MTMLGRIDSEELDRLEQELWRLLENLSPSKPPPPLEVLFGVESECDYHAESLEAYAQALVEDKAKVWKNHPLLEHLAGCSACRERLKEIQAAYSSEPQTRLRGDELDITLFPNQLPADASQEGVRGVLDRRRPILLSAGFLNEPADWHYALEQVFSGEEGRPGLLLTLVSPQGAAANAEVRVVLFGRIAHRTTDENGQVFFPDVLVSPADDPLIPAIHVNLHLP
ncbi:MAG: hypothetical protein GXP42_03295 [Chloroflexi bacterium]|nr:hypothetical protein [Chloroflexota bacterium]